MEVHYKEVFLICRTVGMTYQSKMLGRAHITPPALQMIIIEVEVIIGVLVSLKPFPCVVECNGSQPTCLMTS